nr:uncharacterized protein LOC126518577 [Dermacentor andersoni]
MYQSCLHCINAYVVHLLLVLSGDVELNPGPVTLESIAEAISRLEQSQNTVLTELSNIRSAQTSIENHVSTLSLRVDALENIVHTGQAGGKISEPGWNDEVTRLSSEIKNLTEKCDDAENRLRRSNLIFFGITDAAGETWEQSEEHVIAFCSEHLGVSINADDIERAHRMGRFQESKNRPIIVKLAHFKVKSKILTAGPKLKKSKFSVREDYSAHVRLARKKLYSFVPQERTAHISEGSQKGGPPRCIGVYGVSLYDTRRPCRGDWERKKVYVLEL